MPERGEKIVFKGGLWGASGEKKKKLKGKTIPRETVEGNWGRGLWEDGRRGKEKKAGIIKRKRHKKEKTSKGWGKKPTYFPQKSLGESEREREKRKNYSLKNGGTSNTKKRVQKGTMRTLWGQRGELGQGIQKGVKGPKRGQGRG